MLAALTAAVPAWAQHADREQLRRQLLERPQRPPPGEARPDLRGGGQNRLSPEERRQLRQDIGNAGRELYPRRPQRPMLRR